MQTPPPEIPQSELDRISDDYTATLRILTIGCFCLAATLLTVIAVFFLTA